MLDAVLSRAFNVAKRIRTETEIGEAAVSVSYAAVELAREIFGSLQRKSVLDHRRRQDVGRRGAESSASGRDRDFDYQSNSGAGSGTGRDVPRAGDSLRAVPAAAGRDGHCDCLLRRPEYVLTREMVRRTIEARKNQPMFLIDIAVPRNIEPRRE